MGVLIGIGVPINKNIFAGGAYCKEGAKPNHLMVYNYQYQVINGFVIQGLSRL